MPLYETVFIVRPDATADEVDSLTEKLSKVITDDAGKIISTEYWGLRTLAYKINKSSRGHYVLLNIEAKTSTAAELKRLMSFNEDIIRTLTFKVEAHQPESMLFASKTAKTYKPVVKKDPSKTDLLLEQVQFEV